MKGSGLQMSVKLILLILLAEIFICSAQFLFKTGANSLRTHSLKTVKEYTAFIKSSLRIPSLWAGVLLNSFAVVVWIIVLALVDLSMAIPLDSLHYIVILIGSHFLLKERITWTRIAGTLFIISGIAMVAF